MPTQEPKKRRRDRGDGTIAWDKINKCYVGSISLGFNSDDTRNRRSVRGRTKTEVKDKLDELRQEINAGVRTPATYTVELCVKDWLESIERDPHTMEPSPARQRTGSIPRSARRSSGISRRPTPTGSSGNSARCSASERS